ncbi:MAG: alkaline phosphatase family protein [Pirellulaceae bacterium]|nr:MAG: alkaline phosphatase family protein [Pirellulaceae bacterium]
MMKLFLQWLLVVCLLAALLDAACGAEPQKDRCVILVSVDGLAGFYLDDPVAHMPTLRRMAVEGARAAGMVCSFPTVTWPNHTTLVTGVEPARHGVLGNNYLDRSTARNIPLIVDPLFDKDEIVKVPTIYDVAHAAGLTTAAIVWPATRNARTLHFTVPDMKGNESWARYGTTSWLAELREAGVPVDRHGTWVEQSGGGVQRDWLYVRMAAHLLQKHAPNLLLIHLVEVDHVQHREGPRSADAYWSVSYADSCLRDLVDAVARSPRAARTTIIVTSDHGFFPIDVEIRPQVLMRKLGLRGGPQPAAASVSQGGACAVYILDQARRKQIADQLAELFQATRGIQAVLKPAEFSRIGQPTPDQDPRAPDLWLSAESGFSFSDAEAGEDVLVPRASRAGTHGYLPDQPDMLGTLVLWGHGIRSGVNLGKVKSVDVAPTIAALLGLEMPDVQGRVLHEALAP